MAKVTTQPINPYSGISMPSYADPGPAPVKPKPPSMEGDDTYNPQRWEQYQKDLEAYNQNYSQWLNKSMEAGFDSEGKPISPEFVSMIDPKTGRLREAYEMTPEEIQTGDIEGWSELKDLATGEGLSRYGQAAQEQLDLKTKFLRDQATQEAAGAQAQAMAQLGMRGGLSSGARERIATGINPLMARQEARQAQLMGTADIGMRDAAARQQALGQFTGMGADITQANVQARNLGQEFNIRSALDEMQRERQFGMERYKELSQQWAAKKKADAQRAAAGGGGGGPCFITTAVCETLDLPDDNYILNTFRKFRDDYMGGKKELQEYYEIAPKIVEKIGKNEAIYKDILATYLIPSLIKIEKGELEDAKEMYKVMVLILKEKYLGA